MDIDRILAEDDFIVTSLANDYKIKPKSNFGYKPQKNAPPLSKAEKLLRAKKHSKIAITAAATRAANKRKAEREKNQKKMTLCVDGLL